MDHGRLSQEEYNMGKDLSPKFKRSRREGIDLHPDLDKVGTPKSPMIKKNYGPGMHGPNARRGRISNYGEQLRNKQKAKRIYGVLERQFSNYYKKALSKKEDTGDALLEILERRLDNVVYRAGLAKTRPSARQMVSHGHILLNGKKATIPSIQVSKGDTVSVISRIAKNSAYLEKIKQLDRKPTGWLSSKSGEFEVQIVDVPEIDEPKSLIDVRRIVEFYSR